MVGIECQVKKRQDTELYISSHFLKNAMYFISIFFFNVKRRQKAKRKEHQNAKVVLKEQVLSTWQLVQARCFPVHRCVLLERAFLGGGGRLQRPGGSSDWPGSQPGNLRLGVRPSPSHLREVGIHWTLTLTHCFSGFFLML